MKGKDKDKDQGEPKAKTIRQNEPNLGKNGKSVRESNTLKFYWAHRLRKAPYNPSHVRCNVDDPEFQKLVAKIREYGQVEPVIILRQKNTLYVVEGHRRVAACELIGIPVMCIVYLEIPDREKWYVDLNDTKAAHSGKRAGDIYKYLHEPNAVKTKTRRMLERLERELPDGLRDMLKMEKLGLTITSVVHIRSARNKLEEIGSFHDAREIAEWAVKNKQINVIRDVLQAKIDVEDFRDALEGNYRIRLKKDGKVVRVK